MGKSKKKKSRPKVHYRHYGRLLSYLLYNKTRCVLIILALLGEAWLTIFGLVLLKPVLDLVFLGNLFNLESTEITVPYDDKAELLTESGQYVVRMMGTLTTDDSQNLQAKVLEWLDSDDVQGAILDVRRLENLDREAWISLNEVGLMAGLRDKPLLYLADLPPPEDVWPPVLADAVAIADTHPDLVATVEQVPLPKVEEETPSTIDRWKTAAVDMVRGPLERFESYATRSTQNKYNVLVIMALLITAATLLRCVCGFLAGYLTEYMCNEVTRRIKDELFEHMLVLDDSYHSRENVGRLQSYVTQDVPVIKDAIETIFLGVIKGPINLFSIVGAMIILSPSMTLATMIMLPLLLAPMLWVARRVRRYSAKSQEKKSSLNIVLHEVLSGIRIVRAYATERREHSRFGRENDRLFRYNIRKGMANSIAAQTTVFLSTLGACATLLIYGYYILELETMSGSDFIVFIGLMFTLYRPLKGMTKANNKVITAMAGAERFFTVLDHPSQIVEKPDAKDLPPFHESIRLEGVTFAYDDEPVLREVDLEVPAGKVIALVGASGSGKTTMVNLLPRFWDPQSGRVVIDGHDVRDLTLASLRRQIAIVTQESVLFDETVRNNIAYGVEEIDDEKVFEAAKAANAHGFITDFPEGYKTVIGDRGQRISGGQKQRLAIARALVKGAPILILDEATSALDTEAEREVQAAIDRLLVGRTALVIAHRLSTVVNADEIIVLRQGRIVERGSHEALLAHGGEYAKLYKLQFKNSEPNES